jgi:hypothetical protein
MNNYGQIVYNVGVRVGDTSTAFATVIKGYVNFRYKEIWERFNWGTIKESYTFNTVAGTSDYKLPIDFLKPLYIYDNTNFIDLPSRSLQEIERVFPGNLNDTGNPVRCAIYEKMNADTPNPTGVIEKWVRFHPTPTSVIAILMPYQLEPTDMSANSDLPILDCDYEVEIGATAEAWRTKRQFAKAADFDQQYEDHIKHMIWRRENDPTRVVQFAPNVFNKDLLY